MKSGKVSDVGERRVRRIYDDACGTALALEFIGERWSLLIMRELVFGPRRFGEIRANLPGISANVLTQRLESLEEAGIVVRRRLPATGNVQGYELTRWGSAAAPLIRDLGRWAAQSPRHDPLLFMSAASAMMSLQALVDRERALAAEGLVVAFRLPDDRFAVRVTGASVAVRRGEPEDVSVTFTGDTMALRHTIYGKVPLGTGEQAGGLAVEGDLALAQRFVDLFALPEKVAG